MSIRRLTHVLVIVLTLVVGAAAAAIIVSQTAWFKNWLRGYIVREANQYLNGTMTIQRLGGNLFYGIEMENIAVSMDGADVVAVKDLGLDYNVFELFTHGLSVDNIRLNKPVIYLRREGDTWSLSRLLKKQMTEADRRGPARPITIDDIGISDGQFIVEGPVGTSGVEVPKRLEHLDAKLSFKYEPVRYSIEIAHVSFRGSEPAIALNALSGGVAVHDDAVLVEKLALRTAETSILFDGAVQNYLTKPDLNLQITSDKLSVPEIAQLVPALARVKLQPAIELKVRGTFDELHVNANVRSSAGDAIANVVTDFVKPGQSVKGDVTVRHIDLSGILGDPKQQSDITGNGHVDVSGESFSKLDSLRGGVSIDSPRIAYAKYAAGPLDAVAQMEGRRVALTARATAYGASATASGRVTLPDVENANAKAQPIPFDLSGQVRRLDLRKLPRELNVPPAGTNLNADYHARGTVVAAKSAAQHVKVDAKFLPSTVAGANVAGGSIAIVSLDGDAVGYSADATVADLNLRRVGGQFRIPALDVERYATSIKGHVVADGRGTRPETMNVTARGSLTDTSVLGGTIPHLDFEVAMADDTAHVKANGGFAGFDPAAATGKEQLKGSVGGTLDADATVARVSKGVGPDSVEADARIVLEHSTVGGLEISRASVDGTYHKSTGDIRTLEIVGRDLNVTASGTLALNETDHSNLKVHADSPSLETIGMLFDQPVSGIAKVDATVTGNKRELQAAGNLTADGFRYQENSALTASSDFTASVPELSVEDASVTATTHATFLTLAGQTINDLDAKTTYKQKQIEFDATAKQPQRSLGVGGTALLHPDHQEVHLTRLAIDAQGQKWQLATGSQATIDYANDAVALERLTLVNSDQRIAADGRFGRPGDALKLTLTNVDLASVDAMLLRPPQFTGRLNASGTIVGTKEKPEVDAEFQIAQGGFRQFKYDSFGGTVTYAGPGLTLDTKLQQNRTTYLTAKGYVPVAAFKAAQGGGVQHHTGVPPEESFDLHIDSTPIDLGLVQGFTTELTNVTGTVQAKIDVTGAADDPHPQGAVTIQNGAMTVEASGVHYANVDGRIDLQPDKIHVERITVLDNRRNPMTISGDLAVHERQLGSVSIALKTDDFKILDNEMGNVRVNADLRLTGEIAAPRIEGELGMTTGTVNLDPILAAIGETPYATEQTEYLTKPGEAAPKPSAFDALQADVHVTVPNDLVVKASDLKVPGAVIGLGALNITLGGDLWASKSPWDQVRLVGTVNTIRGHYDFQGRRFDILRDGTVRFEGTDDFDPALDLRTQRIIQAVTANVAVRGTLTQPEIVLTSVPPLEPADILALIVFNQPLNSVGEGQQISLLQRAQALAGGAVTSEFTQSIANALNIDEFEIQLTPETGSPTVTLGQQVGPNLYVKLQQGVGALSQTNFILEYELTKWLRMRTNMLQGSPNQQQPFQRMEGSGADVLFFFSY
jgi:autotransporter translocation and assembly factor TamB